MNFKIKLKRINFSKIGLLYILSMTLVGVHQAGIYNGYYLTPFLIGIAWFGFGIIRRIRENKIRYNKNIDYIINLFLRPWIIFIAYNFFLYITGYGYMEFVKSSFVQIMFVPCIILGVWGAYNIFGENTQRYLLYSIFLQYIVVLIALLVKMRPNNFVSGTMSAFTGDSINNPFEANSDVVLSLGILLIYLSNKLIRTNRIKHGNIWVTAVVFFLGGKRICFVSIVCVIIYTLFAQLIPENKRIAIQNVVSGLFICGYMCFVYIIKSGLLSAYIWSHGINSMGRINMWDYISHYYDMKLTFLGNGYSFCNLILERDRPYTFNGHVYALHSDALKMYIELGFVMFLFWLVYNLYIMTNALRKKYGSKVSNIYWAITAYIFILYLTDNPINYYITQTTYIVVVLQIVGIANKRKMRCM